MNNINSWQQRYGKSSIRRYFNEEGGIIEQSIFDFLNSLKNKSAKTIFDTIKDKHLYSEYIIKAVNKYTNSTFTYKDDLNDKQIWAITYRFKSIEENIVIDI